MKVYLSRLNPVSLCSAIAATLAVAFASVVILLDHFSSEDLGCSGDPACIAEIKAEFAPWLSPLGVLVGMLFIFIISFGSLLLGLGIFVAIRDRWSGRR
jgi:hypothetical protein